MTTGERIRAARKAAGMTQEQVADQLGITKTSLRFYEQGKRHPKPDMVERIAYAVGVIPQSLEEHKLESTRDVLEVLFRLEGEYGLVPTSDGELAVDDTADHAPKLRMALKQWADMRDKLASGEITQEEYDSWKTKVE